MDLSFFRYAGAGLIGTAMHFLVLFAALDYGGAVVAETDACRKATLSRS